MFMHFLPGISLVILRRQFVAEVRWLFPVSRQKKRESGKQRNTEPWRWELNENTAFSEISATCSPVDIANILSKCSAVPVYCLFVLLVSFSFYGNFFCLFLFSVYKPASNTETGSKDDNSKKWQNMHNLFQKQQSFMDAIMTLCF